MGIERGAEGKEDETFCREHDRSAIIEKETVPVMPNTNPENYFSRKMKYNTK